jgi:ribonucleoside-triphosphate reductase
MKKFQNKYGKIKNVSEREFFTNSVHVPVWTEISAFEKIDIESQLDGYSSAGCILYTELDGTVEHNLEGLETLVNYAMDKDVPYFAVNVPNDTCLNCGYTAELNDTCPMCGGTDIQRLRRVTGYLTGNYTTAFNPGKQSEVEVRYKNGKGKVIKVDNEIC